MVELEVDEQLLSHPQLKRDYRESGEAAHKQVYKEKPERKNENIKNSKKKTYMKKYNEM